MAKRKQTTVKRAVRSPARVLRDITPRKRAEEALRQSQQLLEKVFASLDDAVFVIDPSTRTIVAGNAAAARIFGYTESEMLGRNTEFLHVDRAMYEQFGAQLFPALNAHGRFHTEYQMRRKDGSTFFTENVVTEIVDDSGRRTGVVSVMGDITARKRAEEALRASAINLARTQRIGKLGSWEWDIVGNSLTWSDEVYRIWGVDQDFALTFENIAGMIHPDDRELNARNVQELLASRDYGDFEFRIICPDQSVKQIYQNIEVTRAPSGQPLKTFGIMQDITARKRAEEERERLFQEVQHGREQLQALSRRLVEVQETERRFIARELHDEVGQILTGLKLSLEITSHLPADTLRARLSDAQSLVEQLMEQVQGLSLDLRPTMLDDLGLLPALLWLTKRFADRTGVRVHLEHAGLDRRFAPEIETAAYRITQEALTNVARHAGIEEATTRLWVTQDTLNVQIEDRGQGFHVQAARDAATSSGLSGMRERAAALGGNLTIESTPGVGTRVDLQVPLSGTLERRMKER
jgi:PAS domain S-box-containing protein